ncbi:MAG: YheU family protein [Pseudomonadota bacterium]
MLRRMPHTGGMEWNDEDPGPAGEAAEPVEVPWTLLSADVLRGVVEAFVLREGTDYGAREFTHEQKIAQVLLGVERGEVKILFDPQTESVTLLPRQPR